MSEQTWNVETYARNGAFVPAFGTGVVEWLAPRRGERILDLGCGDGVLTERIAASGAIVVGVDGSPSFVAAARAKGIEARLGDAHELAFDSEFDAVFSNAALHWMLEPDRVIAGVARALVPGGRFVAELGGSGNVAAIFAALNATLHRRNIDATHRFPWYFPSADEYAGKLRAAGFTVERIDLFERPTPLPTGMRPWLATFCQPFFAGMTAGEVRDVTGEVTALLEPTLRTASGEWVADYVRLRFAARSAIESGAAR